jgi:predicted 3-demethylubiquinone-9 3-methyltransferase (glyoxalase superfamily)
MAARSLGLGPSVVSNDGKNASHALKGDQRRSEEPPMPKITPFLWFDDQAEEAAAFYVSVFPNSKLTQLTRFSAAGPGPEGKAMVVGFELDGAAFTALNGGPHFQFTEAVSFVVTCETQAEVDFYWGKLTEGGGTPSQCGWLKDRFGLSWQIVPAVLPELIGDPDPEKARRATAAMLKMGKLDIDALRRAQAG